MGLLPIFIRYLIKYKQSGDMRYINFIYIFYSRRLGQLKAITAYYPMFFFILSLYLFYKVLQTKRFIIYMYVQKTREKIGSVLLKNKIVYSIYNVILIFYNKIVTQSYFLKSKMHLHYVYEQWRKQVQTFFLRLKEYFIYIFR